MYGIFGEQEQANMAETRLAVSQDERLVAFAIPQLCFCSMMFPCPCIYRPITHTVGIKKYYARSVTGIYGIISTSFFGAKAVKCYGGS